MNNDQIRHITENTKTLDPLAHEMFGKPTLDLTRPQLNLMNKRIRDDITHHIAEAEQLLTTLRDHDQPQ